MTSPTRLVLIVLAVLFAASFFAGCSDDDDPAGPPAADTTPPNVAAVVPIHSFAIEVAFNEPVTKATAERLDNYTLSEAVMVVSRRQTDPVPAAELNIMSAALYSDAKTVLLSTLEGTSATDYTLKIENISDLHGNKMPESSTIRFAGINAADDTPPTITYLDPGGGGSGVGKTQPVFVTFSEPMQTPTVFNSFSWTVGGDRVPFSMQQLSANAYAFIPTAPLEPSATHSVGVSSAAKDRAGISFAGADWSFSTASSSDITPPTLESSTPEDGATGVDVESTVALTFSEAINPLLLEEIVLTPEIDAGTVEWFDDGRTMVATPDDNLRSNTQYALTIPKGSVADFAGNTIKETITIRFTTAQAFASGSITGTLSGDPFSVQAADPTGAIVVATTVNLFGRTEEDDIDIFGTGTVETDDTYLAGSLPENVYYPFAIMDSNNDGILNPELGDAFGAFGVNIRNMDESADPVPIAAGAAAISVDFPLFDPSAIFGTVYYAGQAHIGELGDVQYMVGAWDAIGFDPDNLGDPEVGTEAGLIAHTPHYRMDTLNDGLPPGTYYVGAFLDVNATGTYEPSVDPAGFYSNRDTGQPLPVSVESGSDAGRIDIYFEDPSAGGTIRAAAAWSTNRAPTDTHTIEARKAQSAIRKILERLNAE